MILHSQVAAVSEWCSRFPEEVIRKRPALCIFHGWALIIAFKKDDFPAASVRIEQAEANLAEIDPNAGALIQPGRRSRSGQPEAMGHRPNYPAALLYSDGRASQTG
jgi:hypothetical protein